MRRWFLGLGHLAWKGVRDFAVQIVVSVVTTVCMSIAGSSLLWKGEPTAQSGAAPRAPVAVETPSARLAAFGHPLFLTAQSSPYRADFVRPATLQWNEEPLMVAVSLPCRAGCAPPREEAAPERPPAPSRIAEAALDAAGPHGQAGVAREEPSWLPRLEAIGRSAGTLASRMAAAVPHPFQLR